MTDTKGSACGKKVERKGILLCLFIIIIIDMKPAAVSFFLF